MSSLATGNRSTGRRNPNAAITLVGVLLAFLVVPMSISGSAVALPRVGLDLDATGAPLQSVVNAYNLTFASFTLVFGSMADLFGRRRLFAVGAALFAAASLLSVSAANIWLLDVARGLAGVGAAGVLSTGGPILAAAFNGAARTRAFAVLGTTVGAGLAIGPTLSGWLIGGLGWRASFLAHAIVLVVALLATPFMAESGGTRRTRADHAGIVTFVGGLALLTLGVVQGPQSGWTSPATLGLLVAAVVSLVVFTRLERRRTNPVLDLSLVRNARFLALCLVPVVTSFGFVTLLTYLPTYFVGVNHSSAQAAGSMMLLMTAPVLIAPPIAGWLVNRGVSAKSIIGFSLLLFAVGNAWLTVVEPGAPVGALIGPLSTVGLGAGLSFGINDGLALSMVPPERTGMAAGFLNTMRIGSEAVVIAVFGSLLVTLLQARLDRGDDGELASSPAALADRVAAGDLAGAAAGRPGAFDILAGGYTEALHTLLWISAGICAVAAVVVFRMLAQPPHRQERAAADKAAAAASVPKCV